MKKNKIIKVFIVIMNIILIIVCLILYFKEDRIPPTIKFEATDIVFSFEMNQDLLLQGISAFDNRDGEITDRIVIEKIIEKDQKLIAYYAVSDKSGNVMRASREFQTREEPKIDVKETFAKAGIENDLGLGSLQITDGEDMTESTPSPSESPLQSASPFPTASLESTQTPVIENTPESVQEEPVEQEDAEASNNELTEEVRTNEAPILKVKMSQISVNVGTTPAWVNVIETMKDDHDDYGTLFRNLHVGEWDKDKKGTYQTTVSTEDSDGNSSDVIPVTIIVK